MVGLNPLHLSWNLMMVKVVSGLPLSDRVLSHRFIKLGRRNVTQYLVRWKGYGDEWNEWRDEVGVTDVATQEYWARVGGRSAPPPHLHKRKRGSRAGKKQQARKAKMAAASLVLISDAGTASH